jgi:hypothetical protein
MSRFGLAALMIVLVAGCGGGSARHHPARSARAAASPRLSLPPASSSVTRVADLLGTAASAGRARSYVPTGRIVADSGFRPQVDGFAFENYGNDAGPINLTAANMQDLFGSQVCQSGSGASCVLSAPAKHWMQQVDVSMADGHCMGFSVSALRFFTGNLKPGSFGGTHPFDLPVQGNQRLQSLIAEDFAYQDLPAVTDRAVTGTPASVLSLLIRALNARKESYTLGIIKADGSGGHALTPLAVEDRGHGQAAIIVYDNNFPGVLRAVDVNTVSDTWHYIGGVNPSDSGEVYTGDASTKSMVLLPTSPGETTQPCPFCAAKGSSGPGAKPSVIDKLHYIEVGITARAAQHPHLVFEDPQGRRTGYINGGLVQQIPGIQVVSNYSVQNWNAAPEPTFHLPLGHPTYTVTVDGSAVTEPIKTQLQINGAGIVFSIRDIRIAPGQKDKLLLPAKDLGVTYATMSRFPASPIVAAQFPQYDPKGSTPAKPRFRLITMAGVSLGFKPGSPVSLFIDPATGRAALASIGDTPRVPNAHYLLSFDSSPINGGIRERFYFTHELPLPANAAAQFFYLHPTTATLPVTVISTAGRRLGVFAVPAGH